MDMLLRVRLRVRVHVLALLLALLLVVVRLLCFSSLRPDGGDDGRRR